VNLILDDWRLKLLALGLGILMLGAVAFAQNPPKVSQFIVPVHYTVSPDLVLINPPTNVSVTVNGLADVIATMKPENILAVVDATKASPGPAVMLNATAKSLVNGVTEEPTAIRGQHRPAERGPAAGAAGLPRRRRVGGHESRSTLSREPVHGALQRPGRLGGEP